ncbi:MAG: hypothetical protein U9N51_02595 [Bacteroidota bacterium]|nr:hypothetical protein [Bacteroidota bacterium]
MKKIKLILILLFALVLQSKGQFYETPNWVRNIPLHGDITAIGISDPRVPSDSITTLQSEIRAKAIIALLNETDIAYTSQYFQVETEEHRTYKLQEIIEKLGKLQARLPYHPDDFSIIESVVNQNKEHIVLMGYQDIAETKTHVLNVYCEFYSKEYEVSNTRAYAVAEIVELHISDSSENGIKNYTCKMEFDGRDVKLSSNTCGYKNEPPGYAYSYKKTSDLENINEFDATFNLEKGIWQAYFRGLCHAISEKAKNYNSKIKNLDDLYRKANESEDTYDESTKQQELSRQVVKNTMQFYLHGLEIDQNMLYINISTPQLDQESPMKYFPPPPPGDSIQETPCDRSFWDWLFGRNNCD